MTMRETMINIPLSTASTVCVATPQNIYTHAYARKVIPHSHTGMSVCDKYAVFSPTQSLWHYSTVFAHDYSTITISVINVLLLFLLLAGTILVPIILLLSLLFVLVNVPSIHPSAYNNMWRGFYSNGRNQFANRFNLLNDGSSRVGCGFFCVPRSVPNVCRDEEANWIELVN